MPQCLPKLLYPCPQRSISTFTFQTFIFNYLLESLAGAQRHLKFNLSKSKLKIFISKCGLILTSLKATQGCQRLIFALLSASLLMANLSASPFECSSKDLLILVECISPSPPPSPHSHSLTRHYNDSHTYLAPPSSLYTESKAIF